MTLPTTAEAIYDLLAADAVISAGLGTYTLPNGTVRAAIGAFAANESLPAGTVSSGIEVAITRVPGFAPQAMQDGVAPTPTWRIYLVGWGAAATLQAMTQRVLLLLPGATASQQGDAPGDGIGVMDQTVVTWSNPTFAEVL